MQQHLPGQPATTPTGRCPSTAPGHHPRALEVRRHTGSTGEPPPWPPSNHYNGYSGSPYTFRVQGDANADGVTVFGNSASNDPVYVPRDQADITLEDPAQRDSLNSYIESHGCLQSQRGQLMRRNSCRNPWVSLMNARLSKVFPTVDGQSIELMADVFNVLNLLDGDWGVRREVAGTAILRLVGYDAANQRGIYRFQTRDTNARNDEAKRWRVQLGARYVF